MLRKDGTARSLPRLPRVHDKFDEKYLQELLVKQPQLLPVTALRKDVGDLLCIGREVPTRDSGTIDNLYLSTGGYPVIVETKLWRNPQARREVVSQALDYVKDVVSRDFDWFEAAWHRFCQETGRDMQPLLTALSNLDEELDETQYVDRLHLALSQGDVLALIVGDGIETRLQQLVSHLCRESAHLRYALGLVELRCYELDDHGQLLVVPRLVDEVEPVQRAYVRIEFADGLEKQLKFSSVVDPEPNPPTSGRGPTLSEQTMFDSLKQALGQQKMEKVRVFYDRLCREGLEPDFKSSAVMLKVTDPTGEGAGISLLAIEQKGRVYNPNWLPQYLVRRWHWDKSLSDEITNTFWGKLHQIDRRFDKSGILHVSNRRFLPLDELMDKLDQIADVVIQTAARIREAAESAA